ncbi:hypothetical protein [Ktedonobacter robiniae]|nr:hypothetical protein [Ktedonobacter robiniae]
MSEESDQAWQHLSEQILTDIKACGEPIPRPPYTRLNTKCIGA